MSRNTKRGQSELIGIALLTGVIVTLIFDVGATVIADWQSGAEDGQRAAIQSDVTATGWTIEHMGEDSTDPRIRCYTRQHTRSDSGNVNVWWVTL